MLHDASIARFISETFHSARQCVLQHQPHDGQTTLMTRIKIFLASSSELKEDRNEFEILIGRKNKEWVDRGVFLEVVMWEDFLDALSKTRLQDEYNKAIRNCDVFVMLFWTKVGQYTEEEFETAVGQFTATNKPFVFTYFKNAAGSTSAASSDDQKSLVAFQNRLKTLGHFYTVYKNTDALKLHFSRQLDKLASDGFIELKSDDGDAPVPGAVTYGANLAGDGAIAQGPVATAVAARGVYVGGKNTGNINTGSVVSTGGGAYFAGNVSAGGNVVGRDQTITHGVSPQDLEPLFASLIAVIAQRAPSDKQAAALQQVQELKAEAAKGKQADDGRIARIVDGLADLVPEAAKVLVSTLATPILGGIAGPVTKFVLEKLKGPA